MAGKSQVMELMANTADGVFAVDRRQRIILWNQGAARILGFERDEVLGKPCFEVIKGESPERRLFCTDNCSVQRCMANGELVGDYDLLTANKDGNHIWLNVSIIGVDRRANEPWTAVHIFRDITARRKAQDLVRDIVERAAEVMNGSKTERKPAPELSKLSPRELEVLRLMTRGANSITIAKQLQISTSTARNHIQHILNKLGVHSTLQAVAYAHLQGIE